MTQKGAKSLVKTAPASGLAPLFEGRIIWQFEHNYAKPRFWVDTTLVREFLFGKRKLPVSADFYRLAFRRQSGDVNERTLITTVIPPALHAHNMASVLVVNEDGKRVLDSD